MTSDWKMARGHRPMTWASSLVTVVAVMATLLPVAEAADLPATTSAGPKLAQTRTVSDCEVQLTLVTPQLQQEFSTYTGIISWHNDPQGYSLCYPAGWSISAADQRTVVFTPEKPRQGTRVSIQVMTTPHVMTRDDLRWRGYWFDALVDDMPDADISWQARWHTGNLYGFEANYTYSADEVIYMRWVRLLYVGTRQYWLVAEAPAAANSTRLQTMFDAMMLTFQPDDQGW